MSTRRPGVGITAVCALVAGLAAERAMAQPLGDVAAAEAARRRTIAEPARVITGEDLRPAPTPPAGSSIPETPGDSGVLATPSHRPARLRGGARPTIPVQAVGGGDVALELSVDETGRVTASRALRGTPPFTDALAAAVAGWQFEPAEDTAPAAAGEDRTRARPRRVASRVLVLGVFRPPALFPMTIGTPAQIVDGPSDAVPAAQAPPRMPEYPPNAQFDGVVLLELGVGADGGVTGARVVQSAGAFDQPALAAAGALDFRPARVHGNASPAWVYLVAAFRQPVTP